MSARAKLLSSEQVFAGRVFGVRRDVVIEPGGVRVVRDIVTHHGSVVLLPLLAGGRILMVRQYRHAVGGLLWELCAGRIEPGESPLAAAQRELREETGYSAKRFRKLLDFFPSPGFVSERMILYAADGLTAGETEPDADEAIETKSFRLGELERWIRTGKIRDGKSVAGILYYTRFILRRGE
jgi:ADP-ribose pyrophosphatase